MLEIKELNRRLEFSQFPTDWSVVAVSVDWQGEPLVLFQEGKPPRPEPDAGVHVTVEWLKVPPRRHHLHFWQDGMPRQVSFENPNGLLTTAHVQPFENGWLVGEARGGYTRICDKTGNTLRTLDLGDGSKHVQTTPDGRIWVGYFDEGVFGGGIGQAGLICFASDGKPIFNYFDFAKKHDLPFIDDCYTLNVADSTVWLSYYSAFPLVYIRDLKLEEVWREFVPNRAVAIRGDRLILFPAYGKPYLMTRTFKDSDMHDWQLIGVDGRFLSKLAGGPPETTRTGWYVPFRCVARGSHMYIYDEVALYELPVESP